MNFRYIPTANNSQGMMWWVYILEQGEIPVFLGRVTKRIDFAVYPYAYQTLPGFRGERYELAWRFTKTRGQAAKKLFDAYLTTKNC